jgi:hypothetical protein
VLHQLVSQPAAMQPLLARWGVPLLATQPWRSGTEADWAHSAMGLPLSDVPYYLAQPEGAGRSIRCWSRPRPSGAAHGAHRAPGPGRGGPRAAPAGLARAPQGAACAGGHGLQPPPGAATSALRS